MEKNQKKDEAEEERKRRMRLRGELPAEEDEPEEDWDPEPIRTILPYTTKEGDHRFIVSCEGSTRGLLFLSQFFHYDSEWYSIHSASATNDMITLIILARMYFPGNHI